MEELYKFLDTNIKYHEDLSDKQYLEWIDLPGTKAVLAEINFNHTAGIVDGLRLVNNFLGREVAP